MAGLVPAIPIVRHCARLIEIAGTSPAMTKLGATSRLPACELPNVLLYQQQEQEETMTTKSLCGALLLSCLPSFAFAQTPTVKIGVLIDQSNSAVALAVNVLARDLNKVLVGSGAGTADLTGKSCTPNTIHWTYDTWELGHGFAKAIFARGGKKWFFISADYAFGKDLESNAADEVTALGGQVLGAVRAPIGNADFSSYLLRAQASGADTIAFANAGGDLSNALKQAAEFGLVGKVRMPGFVFQINNVQALGLNASQGVLALMPFYWDQNDASRAFAKRFQDKHPRKIMPNDMQAGVYAATVHYLKAVAAVRDGRNSKAVVAKMKELPTSDPLFGEGTIRPDGRKIHAVHLYEAKKPSESRGDWDYFKLISTVPADQAFRPLADGGCALVKG